MLIAPQKRKKDSTLKTKTIFMAVCLVVMAVTATAMGQEKDDPHALYALSPLYQEAADSIGASLEGHYYINRIIMSTLERAVEDDFEGAVLISRYYSAYNSIDFSGNENDTLIIFELMERLIERMCQEMGSSGGFFCFMITMTDFLGHGTRESFKSMLTLTLNRLGVARFSAYKFDSAIVCFEAAIRLDLTESTFYYNLARAKAGLFNQRIAGTKIGLLAVNESLDKIYQLYEKAISLDSTEMDYYKLYSEAIMNAFIGVYKPLIVASTGEEKNNYRNCCQESMERLFQVHRVICLSFDDKEEGQDCLKVISELIISLNKSHGFNFELLETQ